MPLKAEKLGGILSFGGARWKASRGGARDRSNDVQCFTRGAQESKSVSQQSFDTTRARTTSSCL